MTARKIHRVIDTLRRVADGDRTEGDRALLALAGLVDDLLATTDDRAATRTQQDQLVVIAKLRAAVPRDPQEPLP